MKIDTVKKLVLVGAGASGKDFLRRELQHTHGYRFAVAVTDRPKREGETDGVDYRFVSTALFERLIADGRFLQHSTFAGYHYGTLLEDFERCSLFIMSPDGLSKLTPQQRKQCYVIYVKTTPEKTRERMERRAVMFESIDSRIKRDEEAFRDFRDYDMIYEN